MRATIYTAAVIVITTASVNLSAQAKTESSGDLFEVIVSAQKKLENLQDVPMAVSVINAETLTESNRTRLADYFYQVPGLAMTTSDAGSSNVSIRGLNTSGSNPTVAFTVDDVPISMALQWGGGLYTPQINASDLAQVEILRGPQGTLYGSNSLGGLIKYVTIDPSTASLGGRFQASMSNVSNGDGLGYNVSGAINVPLSETFAVRASAFSSRTPGWIDDPILGVDGINESNSYGTRLAALWRPSDDFTLKLSGFYQKYSTDGSSTVQAKAGLTGLQQNFLPHTGYSQAEDTGFAARITARLGAAELTSITGYARRLIFSNRDFPVLTRILSRATQAAFGSGVPNLSTGLSAVNDSTTRKISQELRLSAPLGERFDWMIGAFYTKEDSVTLTQVPAVNWVTGDVKGQWWNTDWWSPYQEKSLFTNLTTRFTDRLDVQIGARISDIGSVYDSIESGPFAEIFEGRATPFVYPTSRDSESAFTYLFTPRYRLSDELMTYLRVASGYRVGGPNAGADAFGLPAQFGPDKTQNYELGIKGNLFASQVAFDLAVYYIDWKSIQLGLTTALGYPYVSSVGSAASKGLELSAQTRPFRGVSLSGWVNLSDANLTTALPVTADRVAPAGSQLPASNRWSANLAVNGEFTLAAGTTGFWGLTQTYQAQRVGLFPTVTLPNRLVVGGYGVTDLRAGIKRDGWSLQLFGTNITDKRAAASSELIRPLLGPNFNQYRYIRPREVGLSLTTTF